MEHASSVRRSSAPSSLHVEVPGLGLQPLDYALTYESNGNIFHLYGLNIDRPQAFAGFSMHAVSMCVSQCATIVNEFGDVARCMIGGVYILDKSVQLICHELPNADTDDEKSEFILYLPSDCLSFVNVAGWKLIPTKHMQFDDADFYHVCNLSKEKLETGICESINGALDAFIAQLPSGSQTLVTCGDVPLLVCGESEELGSDELSDSKKEELETSSLSRTSTISTITTTSEETSVALLSVDLDDGESNDKELVRF